MVTFQVKLQNNNLECEVRRFSLDMGELSYDVLNRKIMDIFSGMQAKELELFWIDNESDLVKISSEEELLEAVRANADVQVLKMVAKTVVPPQPKCQNCENVSVLFNCSICVDYLLCGDCAASGIHSEHQVTRLEINHEDDPRLAGRPINEAMRNQRGGRAMGPRGGPLNRGGVFNRRGSMDPRGGMMMPPRCMFSPRRGMVTSRGRCTRGRGGRGAMFPSARGLPRPSMTDARGGMFNPRGAMFHPKQGMHGPQRCSPLLPSSRHAFDTTRMVDPRQMMFDPREMAGDPRENMTRHGRQEMMGHSEEEMMFSMPHDAMFARDGVMFARGDTMEEVDDPREEQFYPEAGMGIEGNEGHRVLCA